jgi:hypothetical protein
MPNRLFEENHEPGKVLNYFSISARPHTSKSNRI